MKYKFPKFSHIEELLPKIAGNKFIKTFDKNDYKVVNYVAASEETFGTVDDPNAPWLKECRGLIFNKKGTLISRPFHKFFNLGEKTETQLGNVDLQIPHVFMEKLDGSMIRPLFLYDGISTDKFRLATKAGITDTSNQAEVFVTENSEYSRFMLECRHVGLTPIFEWCSRQNRVVVDHPNDRLILTALRETTTGRYVEYHAMKNAAAGYKLDVVQTLNIADIQSAVASTKTLEQMEGYVVRFDDGHMLKIKGDWYLQLHRVRSLIEREGDVILLILDEKIDDLYPLLQEQEAERVKTFANKFLIGMNQVAEDLQKYVGMFVAAGTSRKDFALSDWMQNHKMFSTAAFKIFQGEDAFTVIRDIVRKGISSSGLDGPDKFCHYWGNEARY